MTASQIKIGDKFGRWLVVGSAPHHRKAICWEVQCACGTRKKVQGYTLCVGDSTSCGCKRVERLKEQRGPKNPCWKGGRTRRSDGYIGLNRRYEGHRRGGMEHRFIMEQHLGRKLLATETVHHKNGIRHDNNLENLELRSGDHGEGQTVADMVAHAERILKLYAPEKLR